ncbi:MAG: Hsp20/alpha crystallin family protein [Synergistota bacterium]|nr:Hsp20/alpha crystallin family protein [Synergistota bacterium]
MRRYLVPRNTGRSVMDPFSFMDNAMRTMFRDFDEAFRGEENRSLAPNMDLYRKEGKITLVMDLPGISKEDIDLKVYKERIEVRAQRKEYCTDKEDCLHSERFYGSLARMITLPADIDCDSVQANYTDGVLKIEVDELKTGGEGKTISIEG